MKILKLNCIVRKHFFYLFIFFTIFSFSQQKEKSNLKTGTIFGKIVHNITKEPLSYVTIIIKNNGDKVVSGGITNNKGAFYIDKIPNEANKVEFVFIGFKAITKKIKITNDTYKIDFGTISLEEIETVIDEILITSETSTVEQKIDRKVIHIGKDLIATGSNAYAVMQNIPNVNINYQSGSISLRGNENVQILVNGKPSNLNSQQLLKQIPSASIDKIELITNPSAKYTPEGMSGIINLVLKKNAQIGFNGDLYIGVEQSLNARPSAGLNLNYRTGKVNFYTNYNLSFGKYATKSNLYRTDKDFYQDFSFLDNPTSHDLKFGTDIYINDKNTFSLYTSQVFSNTNFRTETKTYGNQVLILETPNVSKIKTTESTYNADYKIDFDKADHNIEFEINYTNTKTPEKDFNKELLIAANDPQYHLNNYTNNIINDADMWLFNLDYSNPISENGLLEVGTEIKLQNTFNKIITNQEVLSTGNVSIPVGNTTFNYKRDIYSAYVNYNHQFDKLTIQSGFRFENYKVNGIFDNTQQASLDTYSDQIFSIYPSAYLTYSPSKKNEFQIGYSRRVDRPSIYQISPIKEWASPLSVSEGNQKLKPQFTNSLEFNYTKSFGKQSITLGTFYRNTTDKIGRTIFLDDQIPDKQVFSYSNYKNAKSYGIECSGSFKLKKWWSLRPNASYYIQNSTGVINTRLEHVENKKLTAKLSNSFSATKNLKLQLSGLYRGQSETIQFLVKPFYMINIGANLTILKGDGSISLRGNDIFNTFRYKFTSLNPLPSRGSYELEYNSIYLEFSYSFGSGKNRERERKYREENETQGSGGLM